jgi:hypothetical protein
MRTSSSGWRELGAKSRMPRVKRVLSFLHGRSTGRMLAPQVQLSESEGAVSDVLMVAVVLAFFTLAVGYVWLCDRIVGPDPLGEPDLEAGLVTSKEVDDDLRVGR